MKKILLYVLGLIIAVLVGFYLGRTTAGSSAEAADDVAAAVNPTEYSIMNLPMVDISNLPVDADGSEVDVLLTATIGDVSGLPAGMTATVTSGTNGIQTIPYSATAHAMESNVVITITWTGTIEDESGKDDTDMAKQGTNLSIPVTLTARQKLATD